MYRFVKKIALFSVFGIVCFGAGAGTFAGLDSLAEERESSGTGVSRRGIFRKMPGENALFTEEKLYGNERRCVLMLSREPRTDAEFDAASEKLKRLSEELCPGNFLFVTDDSGNILLSREIPKTRKLFDLADEVKILFSRLKSVPVGYFPADCLRGKVRTDIFEGNTEFPVPERNGGLR